jgi:ribosome-binding ATPase YchF (GTP1/OBG family)
MILMLVGIIGAPNKGKSTIFSALTLADAEIADYPFTTIKPNMGVAYVTKECVHGELGVGCKPRNSVCANGVRRIPVNIIDVAGLVPGAHLGKGMGNQFLNDLINADALIQVVDVSGTTDVEGKPCTWSDPAIDVNMIKEELGEWLAKIIMAHAGALAKRSDGAKAMEELLSGFKVTAEQVAKAADANSLALSNINWSATRAKNFAVTLLALNKPLIIAANKLDKSSGDKLIALKAKLSEEMVVGCSGAIELALKKASKNGVIEYLPGASSFSINKNATPEQEKALNYMLKYTEANRGTGVQEVLNRAYFDLLQNIVVYPVEDENKYTDHFGNTLPDAILMRNGSTVLELAAKIHTDLAKNMLYAIDAKKKMRVSKDYKLKDNDVLKIVTAGK